MRNSKLKIVYSFALTPISAFIFFEWISLIVLMEGEDKEFHLMALLDGIVKPTEPLWGIIALYIGSVFNSDPFAAAVVIVYALTAVGTIMNKLSVISLICIIFSPGLVYLASQAMRQGFAIGFLLFSLGVAAQLFRKKTENLSALHLAFISLPAALIHNSIAIVLVWLIFSNELKKIKYDYYSTYASLFFLGVSFCIITSSIFEKLNTSAFLIFSAQLIIYINSLSRKENRSNNLQISLLLVACITGFIFTISGLRVVVMVALLSPLVRIKGEKIVLFIGLVLYPLFSSFYFGEGLDKVLPLQ